MVNEFSAAELVNAATAKITGDIRSLQDQIIAFKDEFRAFQAAVEKRFSALDERICKLEERICKVELELGKLAIEIKMQRWTFSIGFGIMFSLQGAMIAKMIFP